MVLVSSAFPKKEEKKKINYLNLVPTYHHMDPRLDSPTYLDLTKPPQASLFLESVVFCTFRRGQVLICIILRTNRYILDVLVLQSSYSTKPLPGLLKHQRNSFFLCDLFFLSFFNQKCDNDDVLLTQLT